MSEKKSTPRKRLFEEIEHLTDLQPMTNASVHGAIVSISPVKKGKSSEYFEGLLSYGIAPPCSSCWVRNKRNLHG